MSIDVELLRESFDKAKPIADEVSKKFYEFLWEDYPASKALFETVDMKAQKKALIGSLVFVVDHVDQPEKLVPFLQEMGKRHVKYGAQDEHYNWVGNTLLKTFAHFFGDDWTEELNDQWSAACGFISQTMMEGATQYTPNISELKDRARKLCDDLLIDILNEGIDEQFEAYVRAKVRRVLFKVLDEEAQALLEDKAA